MPHTVDAVSAEKGNERLRHLLLHSKPLHSVLFALLIIDGLICLTSGVLETHYKESVADDCKAFVSKCVPGASLATAHRRLHFWEEEHLAHLKALKHDAISREDFLEAHRLKEEIYELEMEAEVTAERRLEATAASGSHGSHTASHGTCSGHVHFGDHTLHDAEKTLAYISMGILAIFLVEQLLLMMELKAEYCKPMFLLDFAVITSSLALEIVLVDMHMVGLLVLARTWRFARVGHGVVAGREMVEEIKEEDESFKGLTDVWSQLPDSRWYQISKGLTMQEVQEEKLSKEENHILKEMGKKECRHTLFRALAFARAYKAHRDKKLQLRGVSGWGPVPSLAWAPGVASQAVGNKSDS